MKRKRLFWIKPLLALVVLACVFVIAACAPKQAPEGSSRTPGAEPAGVEAGMDLPAWSMGSDCTSCHASEVASATDGSALCSTHASQGETCTSCHLDTAGALTTAHADYATANDPKKLKKTTVSTELCASCHDVEQLKATTAGTTLLTDTNGTIVNPHDPPINEKHDTITCASCHKLHATEPVTVTAPKFCVSCHHSGVYECGTCHEL